ncbi:MAG: hypothetical protein JW969_20335 [Spirochaetales bacterium]|nr:hypothetical protein [Spirochaetales bacterium]
MKKAANVFQTITLLILFFILLHAAAMAEDARPFRIVLDPGHGGYFLRPFSKHGDKYDFGTGEYLQAFNIGAVNNNYKESELVYGMAVLVKEILDRWNEKPLGEIGAQNNLAFSDPNQKINIEAILIRPPDMKMEEISALEDPNAPYRLYDYPEAGKRMPGRISRINALKPELVVSLHMRNKYFDNDYGGLAILVPPASFLREIVNASYEFRDKPVAPKQYFAGVLSREYLPYLDWFVFERGRSEMDCIAEDIAIYLTGYANKKGTYVIDLQEYKGFRENMVTWPYQRSETARDLYYINREAPFFIREFSRFEEKRRHGGPEGFGGDNYYATIELLRFIKWRTVTEGLRINYRINYSFISLWSLPLHINAISAYLELGCVDSDSDLLLVTKHARSTASFIALGILSLLYGTDVPVERDAPRGGRLDWEYYGDYFDIPAVENLQKENE